MSSRLARLLAALIFGAAGGTVVMAGSAYAAACPYGTGVTVVVNSSVRCDSNGGGSAASNFRDAGHSLTMASRQPGFVCRVDGSPASDPCVNASPPNAYWALFWANGKGGGWVYASSGASGLSVPQGGWVAFKFQTSSSRSNPGVTPYTPPPAPKPKPKATAVSKPKPSPSPSASTSSSASAKPKPSGSASPSASGSASANASDESSDETTNASESVDTGGSGPLVWVAVGLAALLIAGLGYAAWRRSATGRPS